MRRRVVVAHVEIDAIVGIERRCPAIDGLAARARPQHPVFVVARHPVRRAMGRLVLRNQGYRTRRREAAESRIDDERPPLDVDGQEHVRSRRVLTRPVQNDTSRVRHRRKTDRLQYRRNERRVLEAIPAATRTDDLLLNGRNVEPDFPAQQHVQILERNPPRMRAQQRGQRGQRRRNVAREADSTQVSADVDGSVVDHPSSLRRHARYRSSTRCAKPAVVSFRVILGLCSSMSGSTARGARLPAARSARANTRA